MSDFSRSHSTKHIFTHNHAWAELLKTNTLRAIEVEAVTKLLACSTQLMGVKEFSCSSSDCQHVKYIRQTCKSRGCSSCGKKSTDQWIATQTARLPDCDWYHITFTMPDTVWPLFQENRALLGPLFKLATAYLLMVSKSLGLSIGIFAVLHTNGRQLNWHPHIPVSMTGGGIDNTGRWQSFKPNVSDIRVAWTESVKQFLQMAVHPDELPVDLMEASNECGWFQFIEMLNNGRPWVVHSDKKTGYHKQTVNYLGRYLKRPPISGSRLMHYAGGKEIDFTYLDHRDQRYKKLTLTQTELIERIISHIPEKHFRMVRYFGFLSNRVCGKKLPKVYAALGQEVEDAVTITHYMLSKSWLNIDPYACILCGSKMRLTRAISGLTGGERLANADAIARMRCVL